MHLCGFSCLDISKAFAASFGSSLDMDLLTATNVCLA